MAHPILARAVGIAVGLVILVILLRCRLVLIAETYKGQTFGAILWLPMKLLRARYLTIREHRDLLTAAGFTDLSIDTEPRKGWICCVAAKILIPLPMVRLVLT